MDACNSSWVSGSAGVGVCSLLSSLAASVDLILKQKIDTGSTLVLESACPRR